jgi:hypothetical protein
MTCWSRCAYLFNPPLYSDAISRDSSWKLTTPMSVSLSGFGFKMHLPFQSAVGGIIGGDFTWVSMKFNRTPLLQVRLDF